MRHKGQVQDRHSIAGCRHMRQDREGCCCDSLPGMGGEAGGGGGKLRPPMGGGGGGDGGCVHGGAGGRGVLLTRWS